MKCMKYTHILILVRLTMTLVFNLTGFLWGGGGGGWFAKILPVIMVVLTNKNGLFENIETVQTTLISLKQ